jgi:hypothetical protein
MEIYISIIHRNNHIIIFMHYLTVFKIHVLNYMEIKTPKSYLQIQFIFDPIE